MILNKFFTQFKKFPVTEIHEKFASENLKETKKFCRIAWKSFEEILESRGIKMKFCKLGNLYEVYEKTAQIFVQLVNRGNSEEFSKRFLKRILENFELILKKKTDKTEILKNFRKIPRNRFCKNFTKSVKLEKL